MSGYGSLRMHAPAATTGVPDNLTRTVVSELPAPRTATPIG